MALVKLSGLIASISGKLNGSCFQNTNAGIILKNLNKKCVKNTQVQNNTQIFLSQLQNQWRNFTGAQRMEWTQYSSFIKLKQYNNSNRFINGQQTFIKLNYYRLFYGLSILTAPVYYFPSFPSITPSVTNEAPGVYFNTIPTVSAVDFYFILFLSKPVQSSLTNPGSMCKMLYVVNSGNFGNNITNSYVSAFGREIFTDEYCFMKFAVACKNSGLINIFTNNLIRVG